MYEKINTSQRRHLSKLPRQAARRLVAARCLLLAIAVCRGSTARNIGEKT